MFRSLCPNKIGPVTAVGGLVGGLALGAAEFAPAVLSGKRGPGWGLIIANFIIAGAIANRFEPPGGII